MVGRMRSSVSLCEHNLLLIFNSHYPERHFGSIIESLFRDYSIWTFYLIIKFPFNSSDFCWGCTGDWRLRESTNRLKLSPLSLIYPSICPVALIVAVLGISFPLRPFPHGPQNTIGREKQRNWKTSLRLKLWPSKRWSFLLFGNKTAIIIILWWPRERKRLHETIADSQSPLLQWRLTRRPVVTPTH